MTTGIVAKIAPGSAQIFTKYGEELEQHRVYFALVL